MLCSHAAGQVRHEQRPLIILRILGGVPWRASELASVAAHMLGSTFYKGRALGSAPPWSHPQRRDAQRDISRHYASAYGYYLMA